MNSDRPNSPSERKKPKFRVGQIVCRRGDTGEPVRIVRAGILADVQWPVYWIRNGDGYIPEVYLRILTKREAGR